MDNEVGKVGKCKTESLVGNKIHVMAKNPKIVKYCYRGREYLFYMGNEQAVWIPTSMTG